MGDNHFLEDARTIPTIAIELSTIVNKAYIQNCVIGESKGSVIGAIDGCCEFLRQIGQNGNSRLLTSRFSRIH
jgi:hypothetical protein